METERMLLDAEWRQRRAQELVRMLRRERASLEVDHQEQDWLQPRGWGLVGVGG
jgi:hypothetical protein